MPRLAALIATSFLLAPFAAAADKPAPAPQPAPAAAAAVAPPIASRTYGEGLEAPTPVLADQPIAAGKQLAQVRLLEAPGSDLILAPGTVVRLQRQESKAGTSLVIVLDQGTVQVSIANKGRYADVHVIGGALDTRVTGTLFVVERTRPDSDYVALVRGKLTVRLREELAKALAGGGSDHADLESRQGISGGPGGLGGIDALTGRPQLGAHTSSIKDQGTSGSGGWDTDTAQQEIDGDLPPPPMGDTLADDVSKQVADSVSDAVDSHISGEVVNQTVGGNGVLSGSPPPPP